MKGRIHSIETFGTVDGPGIRYVIFTQGCPMRCAYCHNQDTWNIGCGEERDTDLLVQDIARYTRYIEGVTVSGGEPLLQVDFLIELFQKVHGFGLNTCVDTSGIVFNRNNPEILSKIDKLIDCCDLFMLDIKHIDDQKHKDLTTQSNKNILDFARYLDEKGKEVWLRYVLVPSINDDEESLIRWKQFADELHNVTKIEVLPYHRLGIEKYEKLGINYKLSKISEPTQEQIINVKNILGINEGEEL